LSLASVTATEPVFDRRHIGPEIGSRSGLRDGAGSPAGAAGAVGVLDAAAWERIMPGDRAGRRGVPRGGGWRFGVLAFLCG